MTGLGRGLGHDKGTHVAQGHECESQGEMESFPVRKRVGATYRPNRESRANETHTTGPCQHTVGRGEFSILIFPPIRH